MKPNSDITPTIFLQTFSTSEQVKLLSTLLESSTPLLILFIDYSLPVCLDMLGLEWSEFQWRNSEQYTIVNVWARDREDSGCIMIQMIVSLREALLVKALELVIPTSP